MIPLDPNARRILETALRASFPDAHIDPADVEAVALALHRGLADPGNEGPLPAAVAQLDFSQCADELEALAQGALADNAGLLDPALVPKCAGDPVRYYWAEATHVRQHPTGHQAFVGKLPMVRVSLPASAPRTFETSIGTVEPPDHLIATVHEANDKFAKVLGYELVRLDVITPPRQKLRFGAVSVLLGYRDPAALPCCFILEAGTATGQAKVLYLGKTLASTVNQFSGYRPTPFSCSDNAYTGNLTLDQDSPAKLHITARKILNGVNQPAYMDLSVVFAEQHEHIQNIWSGLLIARAVAIVLARKLRGIPDGCEKKVLPT
jgi:hypothetical protein